MFKKSFLFVKITIQLLTTKTTKNKGITYVNNMAAAIYIKRNNVNGFNYHNIEKRKNVDLKNSSLFQIPMMVKLFHTYFFF